jgi:hypothetical protein
LALVVACDRQAGDFDAVAVEHTEAVEGVQPSNDVFSVGCHQDDVGCGKGCQPLPDGVDTDVIAQFGGEVGDGRRVGCGGLSDGQGWGRLWCHVAAPR